MGWVAVANRWGINLLSDVEQRWGWQTAMSLIACNSPFGFQATCHNFGAAKIEGLATGF